MDIGACPRQRQKIMGCGSIQCLSPANEDKKEKEKEEK